MVAASQMSLLPSFVPERRPKAKPVENPSLFGPGELHPAPRNAAKDSARITQFLRVLRGEERAAAGAVWARILRTERGRDAAKHIATDFAAAGLPVSLRTVQGWLNGRLGDVEYVLLADRLYGGVVVEIYEPGSDAARAAKLARLKRLVDGVRRENDPHHPRTVAPSADR